MITQKTIQEIHERAKVEDVVGDYVNLRRRGVNMIGLCPFHNEKTPSFTVSPHKNIYKCFGCGQAGNPVTFVMEHEQMTYPEALRYLANKYGIEIEETQTSRQHIEERQLQDSLFIINEFAVDYFQKQLLETDLGRGVGLSYFKQRGFREETIKKFGLGYAPDKKDGLTYHALQKGYRDELLKKAGLTTRYGRDFFRSRVQFPIRNLSGKVIGFGGRILDKNAKTAKYMNTPESDIYNKSKVLYGAYFAKRAIRKADECIMVEGYTDVISLHQSGIENVVASSGTSLTPGQIQLIKRYTPNMKILYDGDAAGVKAALRGLDLVLAQDMNVKVVLLPDGEDPDSYLQKVGSTTFKTYINEKAEDFILFKTNLILEETKNDPVKRSTLIKEIVESIAKIPDPIKRSVYVRECSFLLEIDEQVLIIETNKIVQGLVKKDIQKKQQQQQKQQRFDNPPINSEFPTAPPPEFGGEQQPFIAPKQAPARTSTDEFQEKDIVRVLMEFGTQIIEEEVTVAAYLLSNMEEIMDDFDNKLYQKIVKECYNHLLKGKIYPQRHFLSHQDEMIRKLAINLTTSPFDYSENWDKKLDYPLQTQPMPDQNFKEDAKRCIDRFKLNKVKKLYKENQERLKSMSSSNMEEMMRILKVQKKLGEIRSELAELCGTVVLE